MPKNLSCPICRKKPAEASFSPFCSKRCADIDLGKWFLGSYSLASDEPLDEASIEEVVQTHEAFSGEL